jgi:hypothetical protein
MEAVRPHEHSFAPPPDEPPVEIVPENGSHVSPPDAVGIEAPMEDPEVARSVDLDADRLAPGVDALRKLGPAFDMAIRRRLSVGGLQRDD